MSKSSKSDLIEKTIKTLQLRKKVDLTELKEIFDHESSHFAKTTALVALNDICEPLNKQKDKRNKEKVIINLLKYNFLSKKKLLKLFYTNENQLNQGLLNYIEKNLSFADYLAIGFGIGNKKLRQDLENMPKNAINFLGLYYFTENEKGNISNILVKGKTNKNANKSLNPKDLINKTIYQQIDKELKEIFGKEYDKSILYQAIFAFNGLPYEDFNSVTNVDKFAAQNHYIQFNKKEENDKSTDKLIELGNDLEQNIISFLFDITKAQATLKQLKNIEKNLKIKKFEEENKEDNKYQNEELKTNNKKANTSITATNSSSLENQGSNKEENNNNNSDISCFEFLNCFRNNRGNSK